MKKIVKKSNQRGTPFQGLSSICNDSSNLDTRIAMLTIKNQSYHHSVERVIVIVEYLQLVSQIMLLRQDFIQNLNNDGNVLMEYFYSFLRIFSPGRLLSLDDRTTITWIVLLFVLFATVLKYLLLLCIVVIAFKRRKNEGLMIRIWRHIFRLQGRVLCFMTVSFSVSTLIAGSDDRLQISTTGSIMTMIISAIVIGTEFIFSLFLQFRYCYVLPTKSLFSSKNNTTEIITFLHKFTFQILQIILSQFAFTIQWFLPSIGLLFSLIRIYYFYSTLPTYNLQGLKFQGAVIMLIFPLGLSSFFTAFVVSLGYETNQTFTWILWAVLSILTIKISNQFLNTAILNLVVGTKNMMPELLVHKIFIIKQLEKVKKVPTNFNEKCEFSFLMNMSFENGLRTIFNVNSDFLPNVKFDITKKESANLIFSHYLDNLANRFPTNEFTRLFQAYFYGKKLHLYPLGYKIIRELQIASSHSIALSAALLQYQIQNVIRTEYTGTALNLSRYSKCRTKVDQIEEQILSQARVQRQIYEEIFSDIPDVQKISDLSLIVHKYRKEIESETKVLFSISPDSYIYPLSICANYSLILNHSMTDYNYYQNKYQERYEKYKKFYDDNNLDENNLYHNHVFMLVSCEKANSGIIVLCSNSVKRILGDTPSYYVGKHISTIATPTGGKFYHTIYKAVAEKGDRSLFGLLVRTYVCHKEGYVIEVDCYSNIHPYISNGFYVGLVIRPTKTAKEAILFQENGGLDGATRGIARKLGLCSPEKGSPVITSINVKRISKELRQISDAINMVVLPDKYLQKKNEPEQRTEEGISLGMKAASNADSSLIARPGVEKMTFEKAMEICTAYTTEEKNIRFNSMTNTTHTYRGILSHFFQGPWFLKLAQFNPIEVESEEDRESDSMKMGKDSEFALKNQEEAEKSPHKEKEDAGDIIPDEDEKEIGWINLRNDEERKSRSTLQVKMTPELIPLQRKTIPTRTGVFGGNGQADKTTTEGFLLCRLKSEDQLLTPKSSDVKIMTESPIEMKHRSKFGAGAKPKAKDNKSKSSRDASAEDMTSRVTHQEKVSNAYHKALRVKYYSPAGRSFCLLFYLVLGIIFADIFRLKMTLNQTIQNLKLMKDIVTVSELRSNLLIDIQRSSLLIWELATGRVNTIKIGTMKQPMSFHVHELHTKILGLEDVNQDLLFMIKDIAHGMTHENLFKRDVNMYDNYFQDQQQTFVALNSFQATENLIEAGLKVVNKGMLGMFDSTEEIYFLLRNSGNDLLLKNEVISNVFLTSMQDEMENIKNGIAEYLIIIMIMVGFQILILKMVIRQQFSLEKTHMFAIAQFNLQKLTQTLNKIISFVESLEDEIYEQKTYQLNSFKPRTQLKPNQSAKRNRSKEAFREPRFDGLSRKYKLYVGRAILLMLTLASTVTGKFLWARNSINSFQTAQEQLYSTQMLKTQVNMVGTMCQDLISQNSTTYNHNNPVSIQLKGSIDSLSIMKIRASNIFLHIDSKYQQEEAIILFRDGCIGFEDSLLDLCNIFKQNSVKVNLINLLSDFENVVNSRIRQFEISDRSLQSLKILESQNFIDIFPVLYLIVAQCESLAVKINKNLENNISTIKNQSDIIFCLFVAFLLLFSLLLWMYLLSKLKETSNNVKRVLQVFPSFIVLSNFTLKTFLMKTSQDVLDNIKNDI